VRDDKNGDETRESPVVAVVKADTEGVMTTANKRQAVVKKGMVDVVLMVLLFGSGVWENEIMNL
jgi:hypothetical protein